MPAKTISILVDHFLENNMYRTLPFLEIFYKHFNLEILAGKIDKKNLQYATHLSEEVFRNIDTRFYDIFKSIKKSYNYLNFVRISKMIRGDFIICYKFLPGMLVPAVIRKISKNVKLIVDIDDYDVAFRGNIDKQVTILSSRLIKFATLVFSGSKFLQEKYGGIYIPTPVKTNHFNKKNFNPNLIREKYKLGNSLVILYMGTFSPHKGIKEIIDIFHLIAKERKNILLLMVGGAKNRRLDESYRNYAKKKCGDRVIFTGFLPHIEMPYFISCADIFLTPVRDNLIVYAQTPAKIAEVQSMEVPIISSAIGEYSNLINDGTDGFLLEPEDLNGFKEKILLLLDDESKRKEMGRNARISCIKNRSYNVVENKLLNILKKYDFY
ncbi:MAG: glycosyltransferase family 4 protein [Candidatus Hodarchaeota archaeon]